MALVVGTNSYVTQAEADAYFADALHAAAWTSANTTIKDQALVTAFRMIDRQRYEGAKTVSTQVQEFPRTELTDKDGLPVDSATVPEQVKEAQYELSLALLEDASVQTNQSTASNVKRVKGGSAEVEFFTPTAPEDATRFPTIIQELLGPFLLGTDALLIPSVSGTSTCPIIEDYDLSDGYA